MKVIFSDKSRICIGKGNDAGTICTIQMKHLKMTTWRQVNLMSYLLYGLPVI